MYGTGWFLQKYARNALRSSVHDTCYCRGAKKHRPHLKVSTDRSEARATRFPRIRRNHRISTSCFGQDVIGPVVITFISAIAVIGVLAVGQTLVGSVLMLAVAAIAAMLAGSAMANAIFRKSEETRRDNRESE